MRRLDSVAFRVTAELIFILARSLTTTTLLYFIVFHISWSFFKFNWFGHFISRTMCISKILQRTLYIYDTK